MADEPIKIEEKVEEAAEVATEAATEATEAAVEAVEAAAEVKEEVKAEEPKKEVKAVSANLEKIIENIEKLSVLELADLVHALEDRFGVSASAAVVAGPAATSAGSGEPVEEKTTFNV